MRCAFRRILGYVESDRVMDSSRRTIGFFDGIRREEAALYFFFFFR
ncbi:hypothetical protein [Cecembia sp.]